MLVHGFYLALSLLILFAGAEGLVRGSSSIARRLGLTPLVIGLTVVAFGTSMPELVVSLSATLRGSGDLAAGNVVGSNIFNIGVILALAALVCPIRVDAAVVRADAPIMIAASLVLGGLLFFGHVSRLAGLLLFAALVAYIAWSIRAARRQASAIVEQEFAEGIPSVSASVWRDVLFLVGGLAVLVAGSRLLVFSATEMARGFGVSEAIIGLTIVSAGTSMPELATSVLAAFRRQADIAVGNLIGSNLFNIFGIVGISALAAPLSAPGITTFDLVVMLVFAIGVLPLLWTGLRLHRWEGALLLFIYVVYLAILWP
ncbi:MAG: calcium/sodium antiporter [Verrucomicrobiales bacterium]